MKIKILVLIFILVSGYCFAQNTLSYTQIESQYNSGIELFHKKTYSSARKALREYIQNSEKSLNPNKFNISNAEYYSALSALYSNSEDADVEVQRFIVKNPDHPKAKIIFNDFAKSFFDKGNYPEAIKFYKKGLENRDDNLKTIEDRYYLGIAYYMTNDFNNALGQFNLVKNTSAVNAINAAYYSGVINFKNENLAEALSDLKRVENVNPYKIEVPNWIAQIFYRQKKYDELLNYTEPIITSPNGRKIDDLCLLTAEVYFFKNNFEKAAFFYDKFKNFRRGAIDEQVTFRHAYSLYKTKKYTDAAALFKNLAGQNSLIGQQSAYYLGISSVNSGDLNAASLAFDTAKKLNFDKVIKEESVFNSIKVSVNKNNNPQAIAEIQNYLKNYPDGKHEDEANEILSDIFFQTNNYLSAIKHIESLKRRTTIIDEAYQKLCFNQGVLEFNNEKFEIASTYFEKSLQKPTNEDLKEKGMFWLAETSNQLNKPNVESQYRDLLSANNQEIKLKSQYNIAYLAFNKKEYDKASSGFSDFLNKSKSTSDMNSYREDAVLRLADCNLINKNFEQALSLYNQAYSNNKTDKDYALYQKGLALKLLDRDAEAKEAFDTFNSKYTNSRLIDDALYQSALLEISKSDYKSAISIFTDLLSKKPNSPLVPQVLLKRGLSFSNIQMPDRAILDYKLILKKYPTSPSADEALLGLKDALNAQNRSEEFFAIAEEYKKINPEASSVTNLQFDSAKDLYYAEKYEKAIAALKNYVSAYPSSANTTEANYLIAESNYILGNNLEAINYYKKVIETNQSEYLSKSSMRCANLFFGNKNYSDAIGFYQTAISATSNMREIILAKQGLYQSYYFSGDYNSAIITSKQVAEEANGTVIGAENKAKLFEAKSEMMAKRYDEAKKLFDVVIKMDKDENAAEAKYRIAEIQNWKRDFDGSIKTLQELSQDYSEFVFWYERGFLLIADDYIAKNDSFMAKATLNSIIENSENKETIEVAKLKLKSIK